MTYQVIVQSGAKAQLYDNALWWAKHRDIDQAIRWMQGFEEALQTLADHPERHRGIPENDLFSWRHTYRQLLYGVGRRPTHRAVFRIAGQTVRVVSIRHLAQDTLRPADIE